MHFLMTLSVFVCTASEPTWVHEGVITIMRHGAQNAAFAAPEPKSQLRGSSSDVMTGASAVQLEADNPSLRVITDDIAASLDPEIERKRAESAEAAWGGGAPAAHDASPTAEGAADTSAAVTSATENGAATAGDADSGSAAQPAVAAGTGVSSSTGALKEMTDEELEAELRRRQAARSS